ncbi:sorting nexin-30-like isoform X2 [Branchiostoma floridae]|uniref:Sorting nexin-30-like isoform X2 n=1 Tax=Branchiostoma floridae TaxID=7739 RepID=A0A9J7MI32_BRAFL|nr:sorting nexin-30-like isoform X2 [Branchiostoma floridae]
MADGTDSGFSEGQSSGPGGSSGPISPDLDPLNITTSTVDLEESLDMGAETPLDCGPTPRSFYTLFTDGEGDPKSTGDDITTLTQSSLAGLRLDDALASDVHDLFVTVDDPEKHITNMESYITYRVTTKTTRSDYDSHEYVVRRRYQDFLWLRERLEATNPTHLIPPLPEKHSFRRLDRFSPEFLKTRQAALQKFLSRIVDHPTLSFNENLTIFLTAKELASHRKQAQGIMGKMGSSMRSMAAGYMLKNRSPEYATMQEYVNTFGAKMGTIDRINQRLLKEMTDYQQDLREFGPVFTLWSNSETELAPAMLGMASGVEKCEKALDQQISDQEHVFAPPVKEYILYAEAMKAVLKRRDSIQMEYELTVEDLSRKRNDREQLKMSDQSYSLGAFLGKDPEEVRQQKRTKLDSQIEELLKQVEVSNDSVECANADLKADLERWHRNKRRDVKEVFSELCDRNIQYYQECLSAWEETLQEINQKSELETASTLATPTSSCPDTPNLATPTSSITPPLPATPTKGGTEGGAAEGQGGTQ